MAKIESTNIANRKFRIVQTEMSRVLGPMFIALGIMSIAWYAPTAHWALNDSIFRDAMHRWDVGVVVRDLRAFLEGAVFIGGGIALLRYPQRTGIIGVVALLLAVIVIAAWHTQYGWQLDVAKSRQSLSMLIGGLKAPAGFLAIFVIICHMKRMRMRAGDVPVCINCGYRMRGLGEPRCPECGRFYTLHQFYLL